MPRPREFDKEEVLEKAMFLFWEQGYEATSIRALKKAMGISSSSMYETFGDKRKIFLAALARYCELERGQVMEMAQSSPNPRQFIENLVVSVDKVLPDMVQNYGSMTFNTMAEFGMRDTDVTNLLFSHYLRIAELVADVLQEGQAAQIIQAQDNPLHLAHVILSTLQGLATIKSMQPDYAYADVFPQVICKLLDC